MTFRSFNECLITKSSYYDAALDMLEHSFFLPSELQAYWTARGWLIQPIQVTSNDEFWLAVPELEKIAGGELNYYPCKTLVEDARYIGVSIRTNKELNITYILTKMWQQNDNQHSKVQGVINHG